MNIISAIEITYSRVVITPDNALEWLSNMPEQRPVNMRSVQAMVDAIKSGTGINDGNPIKFNKEGRIIDGQHRLWAIVISATPTSLDIKVGCSNEMASIMDVGTPRDLANQLAHPAFGVPTTNAHKRAAALNSCLRLAAGTVIPAKSRRVYDEMYPLFSDGIDFAISSWGMTKNRLATSFFTGPLAFAYKASPQKVEDFARRVQAWKFSGDSDPAMLLAKYLQDDAHEAARRRERRDFHARGVNASSREATERKVLLAIALDLDGETTLRLYDSTKPLDRFRAMYTSPKLKELRARWMNAGKTIKSQIDAVKSTWSEEEGA